MDPRLAHQPTRLATGKWALVQFQLSALRREKSKLNQYLPLTVDGWLIWTVTWLGEDHDARASLLYDVKRSVLGSCGAKKDGDVTSKELEQVLPGLLAWIAGRSLADIEKELGGEPNAYSESEKVYPRARELVGSVIPRGLSFVMGLISHLVVEVDPFETQENLSRQVVDCLGTAVRKGYDTPEKVFFAAENPNILSRVQMHESWKRHIEEL